MIRLSTALVIVLTVITPGPACGLSGISLVDTATFSTEELAVRLLPFLLQDADVPAGFRIGPVSVETPAISALVRTPPGADPHSTFNNYQADRYIELHQDLIPMTPDVPNSMNFTVLLMRDAAHATRFAGPDNRPPNVNSLALPEDLGEDRSGRHQPTGQPGQPPRERAVVRWRRGDLVFDIQRETPSGELEIEQMIEFAARVDARDVSRAPHSLNPPTVAAPAGEASRLDAALRLRTVMPRPELVPAGYRSMSTAMQIILVHPAQGVLNLTFLHPEVGADAALARYAGTWRRVYTAGGWYVQEPNQTGARLGFTIALDADVSAAERDVHDPFGPIVGVAQPDRSPSPAPLLLGEETSFRVFDLRGPGDTTGVESFALRWRHGPVVLSAESIGPPGSVRIEDVIAFARAVEAAYQASDLVR